MDRTFWIEPSRKSAVRQARTSSLHCHRDASLPLSTDAAIDAESCTRWLQRVLCTTVDVPKCVRAYLQIQKIVTELVSSPGGGAVPLYPRLFFMKNKIEFAS